MMLNYYDPAAILLSDTTSDTLLYKLIAKEVSRVIRRSDQGKHMR